MSILNYLFWEPCEVPKWVHGYRDRNGDINRVKYIHGNTFDYKLEGSFHGEGGQFSQCYKRRRW